VRLDMRVRAVGSCLRFEIRVAHAERSRQSQLESSEQEKRKPGAFDQATNSDLGATGCDADNI
jgi:hypothetical protein